MLSGRVVEVSPKTTEAAQANRDGLECSSYTWQVRRCICVAGRPKCQEKISGLARVWALSLGG